MTGAGEPGRLVRTEGVTGAGMSGTALQVRRLLAEAVGEPAAAEVTESTPLLAGGLGLDSVAVVRLLAGITRTLGVDVADLDLDLDSLATLGTLIAFVSAHAGGNPFPGGPVAGGMRIGIVGTGHIGGTLARLLTANGHEVAVSNSRAPETLADMVTELGPKARALTATEAAAYGELVIVSIPLGRYRELAPEPYAGKVVIDTGNYYSRRDGHIAELDEGKATSTGLLADHLAGARVVKAFNTIYSGNLLRRGRPSTPAADRLAIPIAGDDPAAKAVVADLIAEIGFTAVETGTLADSWRQEPDTPVYGVEAGPDQAVALIAQARRDRA